MTKIGKYLKPFIVMIAFCLVFLFFQANSELMLPDYMSKIVDYGIQTGGIEYNLPEVISKENYEQIKVLLEDEDKTKFESVYKKVDTLPKKYSSLNKEDILLLNKKEGKKIEQLNTSVGKSEVILYALNNPKHMKQQQVFNFDEIKNIKTKQMSNGSDTSKILNMIPKDKLVKINAKLDSMPESSVNQIASEYVKTEYKALGLNLDDIQSSYIFSAGINMLLLALFSAMCAMIVGFLASKVAAGVARDLRKAVFKKVQSFANKEFNKFSLASLITRSTNDITQLQMVIVMSLRMLCFAPIMGIGSIVRAYENCRSMSWIMVLSVVILIGIVFVVFSVTMPKFKLVQKLVDKLNLVSRENLTGTMVIRAFGMEQFQEERFDEVNKNLTKTNLFVNRVMVLMMPLMMLLMNLTSVLIVWVGAKQIDAGLIQVGNMMAFIQYAMHVIMSFLIVSMVFIMIPRASVSARRVSEVLDTEVELKDPKEEKEFISEKRGEIEFKNVSFAYPGASEYILKDINFTARRGETTAIIGSTGSGKSTLIQLVPRLFDVSKGELCINGVDVRDVSQEKLRDSIGFVPQKGVLFKGTIRSNLQYGDENASDEDLKKVLDIAQASEFVYSNPLGLDREIASGGTNVSGGQRQRLSIARAIAKKADIYVFDDSFSALDYKTDRLVRKALNDKLSDATIMIVAQRISTIRHADKIIVLDEGKIVGEGTHDELIKTCEVYKEIALSQLSKEEVGM